MSSWLGFDVEIIMAGVAIVWASVWGVQRLYNKIYDVAMEHFLSTVEIGQREHLYNDVVDWITEQQWTKKSRHLKAVDKVRSRDDRDVDDDDDDGENGSGIFAHQVRQNKKPPRFELSFDSSQWFRWNGHWFMFYRNKERNSGRAMTEEIATISCLGRSPQPIKNLLADIKSWRAKKRAGMTAIFRPVDLNYGAEWSRPRLRPSRPLRSVVLEESLKVEVLRVIADFLSPQTRRWYANRGIPWRRGLLLHGSPGTGKSSLSFCLGGLFGLGVYCISLSAPDLNEENLGELFD